MIHFFMGLDSVLFMATLVNEELNAGKYNVVFNAATLPSGVYFYQVRSGSGYEVRKILLMK